MKTKSSDRTDSKIAAAWERFAAFMRGRGERITRPRQVVFERVMRRHDHFRADELAVDVALGHDRVSRGTVYRTLALMEKAGLVKTVRDGDAHRHYEHVFGHAEHDHMICLACGRFIEFAAADFEKIVRQKCAAAGFAPTSRKIVVFGKCRRCRTKKSRTRRT